MLSNIAGGSSEPPRMGVSPAGGGSGDGWRPGTWWSGQLHSRNDQEASKTWKMRLLAFGLPDNLIQLVSVDTLYT